MGLSIIAKHEKIGKRKGYEVRGNGKEGRLEGRKNGREKAVSVTSGQWEEEKSGENEKTEGREMVWGVGQIV